MIAPAMQTAINAQINCEQASAQLYLAMAGHCASLSFKGFAHWLKVQAGEETAHADRLIQFLLDRGGRLELQTVPAPPQTFGGIIEVFEQVLQHEKGITARINDLFAAARDARDFATEIALQWYVTEQVEEEAKVSEIVDHLRAVGDKGGAIWYLDSKMGKRQA
ncbi:ferritin [Mesoterricola sediminis]|uniref:Ferritin n=1 Tax=Mesoterricola sediminis TaxID=2927980 RepID=A0AA48HHI9_9BACT|nr:ferritin [Mesoterricola sediminis]BDU78333.1 ferritin [Mesoterricola sediminis]